MGNLEYLEVGAHKLVISTFVYVQAVKNIYGRFVCL
jgi:hypothetical protein